MSEMYEFEREPIPIWDYNAQMRKEAQERFMQELKELKNMRPNGVLYSDDRRTTYYVFEKLIPHYNAADTEYFRQQLKQYLDAEKYMQGVYTVTREPNREQPPNGRPRKFDAEWGRVIYAMRVRDGQTWRQITQEIGEMSIDTARRLMKEYEATLKPRRSLQERYEEHVRTSQANGFQPIPFEEFQE